MTRLLHRLGLDDLFRQNVVKPQTYTIRRWSNGAVIGGMNMGEFERKFGSPYAQLQRMELLRALSSKAKAVGVVLCTGVKIERYDSEVPLLVLANGDRVRPDLLVAADGVHSYARHALLGKDETLPERADFIAFRTLLSVDDMLNDEDVSWLVQKPCQNCWAGPDHHVQAYSMNENKHFNMVWVAPYQKRENVRASQANHLQELRQEFAGWDPTLQKLLRAAMAVEDACLLGKTLREATNLSPLKTWLSEYESSRLSRTLAVRIESLRNCEICHMVDGERQIQRDKDAQAAFEYGTSDSSPYVWSHTQGQKWLYGYDVENV
ncbi:MAG: hypothetical protein Q9162_006587 [Coniocarpon cinnabarinum]